MTEPSQSNLAEAERLLPPIARKTDYDTDPYKAGMLIGAEQYRRQIGPAVAAALQALTDQVIAKQDEIDRIDQLRIDEVSDAQSKAQDIYICAIAENRGLKERVKVLEAALKPFAHASTRLDGWDDNHTISVALGRCREIARMLPALNPTPASTGGKGEAEAAEGDKPDCSHSSLETISRDEDGAVFRCRECGGKLTCSR